MLNGLIVGFPGILSHFSKRSTRRIETSNQVRTRSRKSGHTRNLVKSEFDLHVDKVLGIEGCGRGGLSAVVICCGRACEFIVCGSLADGIRFQQPDRVGRESSTRVIP